MADSASSSAPADQQRLEREARRYQALISAEGSIVWVLDPDLRPTGRNPGWELYTGQTLDEYSHQGWLSAIHPDDRDAVRRDAARALASGEPMGLEFRVRRADGEYRRNAIRAVPVREGDRIVEWIGTAADVEDARRAADEQRVLRARAEAHAARMAFLADASALLGSLDYEATLREVARLAVARLTDWCAVDIAQPDGSLERIVTMHADPARVELARTLEARYPQPPSSPTGVPNVLRTGKAEFYPLVTEEMLAEGAQDDEHLRMLRELGLRSVLLAPLTARGTTLGVVTFVRSSMEDPLSEDDVTVLTEVARRAGLTVDNARLYRDAELANRAKDEFLAILSHELRTPLNAIMGWSHMLRDGLPEDMTRHAIEVIGRNARTQKQLVEDLLDVARIASGRLDLQCAQIDLRDVGRTAVDSALPSARAKEITLSLETPSEAVPVSGDTNRLQQVVANLLSNALKFTDTGGRITVSVSAQNEFASLVVTDTGIGIAPEFLPRAFERFHQADASLTRAYPGLGLGLWVVKQIIEAHGGRVQAESAGRGQGTTIKVSLPRA